MSANKLRGRMYNDICTMFKGTNQQRSEGVINDKDDSMPMCHLCHSFYVQHIAIRIAQSLSVDDFCVGLNGGFQSSKIIDFYDGMGNF